MKRALVSPALAVLFAVTVFGQAPFSDALLGVWKLNLAKSTFDPTFTLEQSMFDPAIGPPPSNQTLIYEARPDGRWSVTAKGVGENGRTSTRSHTINVLMGRYDGKEHSFPGRPEFGTFVLTIIDERTMISELKKDGAVVQVTRSVVSQDGQTLTLTITDPTTTATTVEVFDKQ
jgi:hypothetical protein